MLAFRVKKQLNKSFWNESTISNKPNWEHGTAAHGSKEYEIKYYSELCENYGHVGYLFFSKFWKMKKKCTDT